MIKTLIKNSQPNTESNIRDALISVEMMTAQETNCIRIIKDEKDNCIVSAIINLLKGIYVFNDELNEQYELDEKYANGWYSDDYDYDNEFY